jgi:sarcosine oxidase subunit beta
VTGSRDAVIVGAGIVGAAVAYGLARFGASAAVVAEQALPPGRGATSRSGGVLRQNHTAACDIELAVRGTRYYHDWAELVGGDSGYRRTGFAMLVAEKYTDHLTHNLAAVNAAGGAAVLLDAKDLVERHPDLQVPPEIAVGYEPDGGYADPVRATLSLLAAAGRLGVDTAEGLPVAELLVSGGRVTGVRTNLGTISAEVVVVCAGAWSASLVRGVGVDVPAQPRRIGIARAGLAAGRGTLPAAIDDTLGSYFRPAPDGGLYFGVPLDPEVDPDREPAAMLAAEADASRSRLAARLPALETSPVVATRVGFDLYTPDKRPAIGPVGPEGLYLCTGFSGGGVKLAPAVGELVAAEITTGSESPVLASYRPQRFAAGQLIESEFPYDRI